MSEAPADPTPLSKGPPRWPGAHPAQGLVWQPDLGGGAGAVGPDVGVADVLAAGAFVPGLPQSTPAGPAGGVGLALVNYLAFSLASPAGRGRIPAADSELPEVRARHGPSRQRPSQAPLGWARSTDGKRTLQDV